MRRAGRALGRGVVVAALLAGCVSPDAGEGGQRQAEVDDDGVQVTGTLDQRRLSISNGAPDVVVGDCDPGDGLDDDVCFVTRTIDGVTIAFVIENPAVLAPGAELDVRDVSCRQCDDETGVAVVDIRVDGDQRRAVAGRLGVTTADERYAGEFRLDFAGGDQLVGTFNIRPLRPGEG